ncbi:unnamed protein product, partial [Ectocarpus sp. 8 AP-2014]
HRPNVGQSAIHKRPSTSKHLTSRASQPRSERMAAAGRGWKCGVCNAKAGDLVCGACVTREAERRRAERAKRLGALESVREAATVAAQERGVAVQHDARLQKEEADECRLKDHVREVAKRVAEERITVASAAFALKHHRDLLAAAESHLSR